MTALAFQLLGWAGAAALLWLLARRVRDDRTIALIVAVGLAIRAVGGTLLFFTSLFAWPVAGSLQMGRGIWFYASDALGYVEYAAAGARDGLPAVWQLSSTLPSVFYIKALGTLFYLLGPAASVGILLNLFAYLGMCLVIVAWARRAQPSRQAVIVALLAVSFLPSWILWAWQPLKDSLFLFLMVAYAAAAAWWLDANPRTDRRAIAAALVALAAIVYALAAIRWYVAILFALTTLASSLVAIARANGTRVARLPAAAAFAAIVMLLIPLGAGPYLPDFGLSLLRPAGAADLRSLPERVAEYVHERREGSLRTEAGTMITSPRVSRATPVAMEAPSGPAMTRPTRPADGSVDAPAEESLASRLLPRAAAMFLPRAVGSALGWVEIGGGRGLWAMAETDTLLFDILLIALAVVMVRQFRAGYRPAPIAVHVALSTLTLAAVLCYQTANFGTQFRLRSMIALGFLLLPLTMRRKSSTTS